MAQLPDNGFDASKVDPTPKFETLPKGDYPVMIVDSEMKPTKKKDGQYLQLSIEVVDGPYKGRMIFDRLNIVNQNAQAVEIAQRQLSQICHAVGVLAVRDSAELHNKPMIAHVDVEEGGPKPQNPDGTSGGKYSDKNAVKSYKPWAAGTPAPTPAAKPGAAPVTAAPVAAGSPPPWARKTG